MNNLPGKSVSELSFWKPIAENGFRGFNKDDYRQAAIHFKQYGLIWISRDISFLRGKTVVEFCCGPTAIVYRCGAADAYGIDPLVDAYSTLWDLSRDQVRYRAEEFESFSLPAKADVVICWNGIDHVRDIESTLAQVDRVLKPNGELWTFTNCEDKSWSWKYKVNKDPDHEHQYFFNPRSLDRFFRSHGWKWATKFRYEPCTCGICPPGVGGVLIRG